MMPNRLVGETSPYLRQHADNPVERYPLGEQALALVVEQDKPVLLSIGYSACHWCHVMAHQSFDDSEVADLMYMLTQRSGGWPLTMFLGPGHPPLPCKATHCRRLAKAVRGAPETAPAGTRRKGPGELECPHDKGHGPRRTAFARADWLASAQRAADFIQGTLWREGRLLATYKDGQARLNAYLDDYAFMLDALLELMQGVFRPGGLEFARGLAEALLAQFEDLPAGGFFFTSPNLPDTLVLALPQGISGLPDSLERPVRGPVNAWLCRGVKCLPAIHKRENLLQACKFAVLD